MNFSTLYRNYYILNGGRKTTVLADILLLEFVGVEMILKLIQ